MNYDTKVSIPPAHAVQVLLLYAKQIPFSIAS